MVGDPPWTQPTVTDPHTTHEPATTTNIPDHAQHADSESPRQPQPAAAQPTTLPGIDAMLRDTWSG